MGKKKNILFICSDQHSIYQTGCYGNQDIITPNMDKLAETGTRFECAYSNNPICVPSRASMATGLYGHQINSYDNATPYKGQSESFGHRLENSGINVTAIGKMHYRKEEDDIGFCDQRIPLHIRDGVGDVYSLLDESEMNKWKLGENIRTTGCGEAPYLAYDKNVTKETLKYLEEKSGENNSWMLYVGYTFPHPPFKAPEETWKLYEGKVLPMPHQYHEEDIPDHEKYKYFRSFYGYDKGYSDTTIQEAIKTYYAMTTFLDMQIGLIMEKLKNLSLKDDTIIIYSSDHGEMLGEHGMWGKNCLFEPSARVPLIINGPGIPAGEVNHTNVSLVDIYPTILDCAEIILTEKEKNMPGASLLPIAKKREFLERDVYSEYFATGSSTGEFMLRHCEYKLLYYVGQKPQLFHLKEDPYELCDLADKEGYGSILKDMEQRLRKIVNPEELYRQMKEYREVVLESFGGRNYVKKHFQPVIFSPVPEVKKEYF